MKRILMLAALVVAAAACKKQEYVVFDHPYTYVVWADDASMSETSTIISKAKGAVRTYNICLSSKKRETPLSVSYEITHGDGLEKGVDYEVDAESGSVTFESGTYTVEAVKITFLRHTVDKTKDNTITIRLTGASEEGIALGLPGATPKNAYHTIKKVN